jgi:hypothetical protein
MAQQREAFHLNRRILADSVREEYGRLEGLSDYAEAGLAGALDGRVRDAEDCGAISAPENTEIQTYATGDSIVVCVRERRIPAGTQLRQLATFSLEAHHLVTGRSYLASREGVEAVLAHANDLLPALRALQAAGL